MKITFLIALLFCFSSVGLPQPKTGKSPADIFEVMKEHSRLASENLWPGFNINEIPVAVYDSINTYLFFSANAPDGFNTIDSIPHVFMYQGQHPMVRGNSIIRLGERWVATSVLKRFSQRTNERYSEKDMAGIIVHEQFHIFQRTKHPSWRQNDGVLLIYPAEIKDALFLRRIEKEAFKQAVTARNNLDVAGWAALGLKYRNERFCQLEPHFIVYEKELQRTEGLSDYIEKVTRSLDPLNASEITSGIAPAGVRDLGYVEGRWIAMILDMLDDNWKNLLENHDSLYLEDILETEISKLSLSQKSFPNDEIEKIRTDVEKDFNEWQVRKNDELDKYTKSNDYYVEILSRGNPFTIRIFEPLEIEILTDGGVFHRLIFSAANDKASIRIVNHPCITYFNNAYQLVKVQMHGLKESPLIQGGEKKLMLKYDNISIELNYSEIEINGKNYIVRI